MRELKIELSYYEGRESDLNTLMMLAERYNLEYNAATAPFWTVSDTKTKETLLTSDGVTRVYISGDNNNNIEQFLNELNEWCTKF